jgi:hypothetical protein
MDILRSIVVGAAMLALPAGAQDHRFETDSVARLVIVKSSFPTQPPPALP